MNEITFSKLTDIKELYPNWNFIKGDIKRLPFEDNSFDLVTCQTLLIHLDSPILAVKEMFRVLKPGGKVLISEPNNFSQSTFRNSWNIDHSTQKRLDSITEKLKSDEKKKKNGHGDNSIGEIVPIHLRKNGFSEIRTYMNDKVTSLVPPYSTIEEQQKIDMLTHFSENYPFEMSEQDKEELNDEIQMISREEYIAYNPTMLFLTMGVKPQI